MKQNTNKVSVIFWLELLVLIMIPFIIIWGLIPTNVLNSNFLLKYFETFGLICSILILLVGMPIGIIGIKKAKEMEKFKISTISLSVINITAGIVEFIVLILIFVYVIFGGVSA